MSWHEFHECGWGQIFQGSIREPLWPKLNATLDREPGDCGLGMGFGSTISLCEKKIPKGIKTKLHFVDIMNHKAYV